ncbi:MAG TPA: AAA family ATPase [Lentisphaeria bacterium]|nr:AAA family ATPase [Lentisphaeria bacterium]
MSKKVNVICVKCQGEYHAYENEIDILKCPSCGGDLKAAATETSEPAQAPAAPATPPPAPASAPKEKAPAQEKPNITLSEGDIVALEKVNKAYAVLQQEIDKVIVGQKDVIEEIVVAILANGHCLLEGVPGLAKTLLISSLSKALSLSFKRIQFTPDLMPSDITGTDIIQDNPETGKREFHFLRGPIFANIVLADEINRTPPKTQAAMLEAMQEKQTSVGGKIHDLPKPFFVLATQNPLEQEGTYPLPEAQQDRFLFKIFVGYPSEEEEKLIIHRVTGKLFKEINPVLSTEDIMTAQNLVTRIPVADTVIDFATRLVRATRIGQPGTPDFINKWVAWGCGPRASIALIAGAKARAALRNAGYASCDDVARVAHPVMRHRLAVNYTARAEGINTDNVIDELLKNVPKY